MDRRTDVANAFHFGVKLSEHLSKFPPNTGSQVKDIMYLLLQITRGELCLNDTEAELRRNAPEEVHQWLPEAVNHMNRQNREFAQSVLSHMTGRDFSSEQPRPLAR